MTAQVSHLVTVSRLITHLRWHGCGKDKLGVNSLTNDKVFERLTRSQQRCLVSETFVTKLTNILS